MSKYEYVEKSLGGGWLMQVRKGPSHKGNIRKNPITGRYQFYRGSVNAIHPAIEESNIDTLKEKIEELDL